MTVPFLKKTQQCLDSILDHPADQWSDHEVQVYQLLKQTVDKYRLPHTQVQFKLDLTDIKQNVHQQSWFQESPFQSAIDWYLDQLEIQSFGHSDQHFKLVTLFSKLKLTMTIYHRQKLQIILDNGQVKATLGQSNKIAVLFGLPELDLEQKQQQRLLYDLTNLVTEISLYYQP